EIDSYSIDENKLDDINSDVNFAKQKLDSINREKAIFVQGFESYSGWSGGFIGLIKSLNFNSANKNSLTYLKLSKVGLKIQETPGPDYLTYYTKDGNGYLSKTRIHTVGKHHSVSYVDKKVAYNYSADDNSILILIESTFWEFFIQASILLMIIVFIAVNLSLLKLFINFLIAVSKNKAFDEVNVNRLRTMSVVLLILGCVSYAINFIIYLIFSLGYSSEGIVITHSFWEHDYFLVILSALGYLIYTAFRKAMILQQEQDLTI
ncbi:MAG: DUF2975 domain-containing protein, partial [Pedobacter sp.]